LGWCCEDEECKWEWEGDEAKCVGWGVRDLLGDCPTTSEDMISGRGDLRAV
jgi:hypothetical protein